MPVKKTLPILFLLTFSLLISLACQTLMPTPAPDAPVAAAPATQTLAVPDEQPATPLAPAADAACATTASHILAANFDDSAMLDEDASDEEAPPQYLVTYTVFGDQIGNPLYDANTPADLEAYQNNTALHEAIWQDFTTLIPSENRPFLTEYRIMTDGSSNLLASVVQTEDDPNAWALEVDVADAENFPFLIYTLIHEYGHLLTLGPDQVTPSLAIFNNPDDDDIYFRELSACRQYFPGEGCSHADAYINAFYQRFWQDIYEERQDINLIEDDDAYYEALDEFYYQHEDDFVTDYAVTNPEEDIAESFAFFVLSPRPQGESIAEEKILFFYEYPELIALRQEILRGLCSLNP